MERFEERELRNERKIGNTQRTAPISKNSNLISQTSNLNKEGKNSWI